MSKFLISPFFIFGLFIIIFFGHALGLDLRWYDFIDSLDTIHHALGGVWIAAVVSFLASQYPVFDFKKSHFGAVIFIVGAVAIAGIAWEIFEFFIDKYLIVPGISAFPKMELVDTVADLASDLFGGLFFAVIYIQRSVQNRD